jgi:thiol-disulfide isomerase/thioredoxin
MSARRWVLLAAGAVALAGVIVAGIVLAGGSEGATPVAVADTVPAIGSVEPETKAEVVEASGADPVTGDEVSLSDFAGTPIVLNFWASWCPPCRNEIPALVELAERHPEIALVGVNFQDAAADARALQRELGFDFPSIADPRGELGARLGLQGMPTTFFLDGEHRIVAVVLGESDLAGFEEGVALIAPAGT